MLRIWIYLILIFIAAYVAACKYLAASSNASANNANMKKVAFTRWDYYLLTAIFVIVGGLSIWGAKSIHYWLTSIICVLITIVACWFASNKQPIIGCANALIVMQVFVELATFVKSENANLMFAVFALSKVILIILIAVYSFYANGTIGNQNNAGQVVATDTFDKIKRALAKEGTKELIIFVILVIIAALVLFKLVLPIA